MGAFKGPTLKSSHPRAPSESSHSQKPPGALGILHALLRTSHSCLVGVFGGPTLKSSHNDSHSRALTLKSSHQSGSFQRVHQRPKAPAPNCTEFGSDRFHARDFCLTGIPNDLSSTCFYYRTSHQGRDGKAIAQSRKKMENVRNMRKQHGVISSIKISCGHLAFASVLHPDGLSTPGRHSQGIQVPWEFYTCASLTSALHNHSKTPTPKSCQLAVAVAPATKTDDRGQIRARCFHSLGQPSSRGGYI